MPNREQNDEKIFRRQPENDGIILIYMDQPIFKNSIDKLFLLTYLFLLN